MQGRERRGLPGLVLLSVLLSVLLIAGLAGSFGAQPARAATIGELFGWLTGSAGEDNASDEDTTTLDGDPGYYYGSPAFYEEMDLDEDAAYDTKEEVCAYLVQFHTLPSNYMTKQEARSCGWEGGALNRVVAGRCIGGDRFGNYEEVLPVVRGRVYYECDIDTIDAKSRGAKRIIFTSGGQAYGPDTEDDDWNIYYTEDHYETFTLLYGEDEG